MSLDLSSIPDWFYSYFGQFLVNIFVGMYDMTPPHEKN